jgi:oxygen-dependent protoporphyrinogen oxidase
MPRFLDMEQEHGSLIRAFRRQAAAPANAEEGRASGARYGLFAALANGMSELLEALECRIAGEVTFRRGAAVVSLTPGPAGWRLTLSDGSTHDVEGVILALRAPVAAGLVESFDASLASLLRGIEYASSAIVVTGHKLADVRHPLDSFGLVVPYIERRKILAVSFTSRKFPNRAPEGCVQLRTFVGGAMQPELMRKSDEQLVELVLRELYELLGVEGTPDLSIVCRYNDAMPQYHVGHVARVRQIEELAARHTGLALAGNAYHGVGIPDCIHSGEQAAERVLPGSHSQRQ